MIKKLLALLVVLSQVSYGAVTLDAETYTSSNAVGGIPITFNHTCSGTNRLLVVRVTCSGTCTLAGGVDYNGTYLTPMGWTYTDPAGGPSEIYYMVNPPTGSNVVTIWAASGGPNQTLQGDAISFNGVNQLNPVGALQTATISYPTNPISVSVPSSPGSMVVSLINAYQGGITATAGQTVQWNGTISNGMGIQTDSAGGYLPGSAGNVTDSWNVYPVSGAGLASVNINGFLDTNIGRAGGI